jgi:hypothetical protein
MAPHRVGTTLAILALCSLATCHAFSLKDVTAFFGQGAAADVSKPGRSWQDIHAETLDPELGRPKWWNESVMNIHADEHIGRRSTLGFGESSPVSVTFYAVPGMDCETGEC